MWQLDHKEGWAPKKWCFRIIAGGDFLRVPWMARSSNQSILKEINSEYSMERLMLKVQYFGHLIQRTDSLEKTLMLGKIEDRRRRGGGHGGRGWDTWIASPTQRTCVWVNSGRLWRTGKPGVLPSTGSQRVRQDLVTEQHWDLFVCGRQRQHLQVEGALQIGRPIASQLWAECSDYTQARTVFPPQSSFPSKVRGSWARCWVLQPPPWFIICSLQPSSREWAGRTPEAPCPAPAPSPCSQPRPRPRLATSGRRPINGFWAPHAWPTHPQLHSRWPFPPFPTSQLPPVSPPPMEEEKTYLELYLDQCSAQVSLESRCHCPRVRAHVRRTQESAFILSLVKLLATLEGGLHYPHHSVEKPEGSRDELTY